MQFYKLEGLFADEETGCAGRVRSDERTNQYFLRSQEFNNSHRGRAVFFVVSISGGTFTAGVISIENMDADKQFRSYTYALGLKLKDIRTEEVTLCTALNLLSRASRNKYVEDDTKILHITKKSHSTRI